jgi:heat shock protein HslJ
MNPCLLTLVVALSFSALSMDHSSDGSLFGKKWKLTEISGTAIKPGNAYIEFDGETRKYSGNGGCNRIAGGFTITGMNIKLSQGISTKRACIDKESQKVETDFLKSLQAVTRFEVQDKTLRLFAGGQQVLTFTAN